jgi:DNA (cytosine-5)-methyltransferase 1
LNYIDLFSGIGGFALGAYWAGMKFENHYFSEVDKYCIELYQKRFTGKLPKGEYIISGGFPCQDISIAGKGAGIHGKRSGLWFEYWRIINDLQPRFAIMENVGMLIHRGLREVLGSLAEIGYNAEWQDIRASDVGAPHRRERIWIVANSSSIRRPGGNSEKNSRIKSTRKMQAIRCKNGVLFKMGQKNNRQLQWERSYKPEFVRVVNRIPDQLDRLKGLGNAIVPQIAQILFEQIKKILKS